jgi:hypothetical protein
MAEPRRSLRRIKPESAEDTLEIKFETDASGVTRVTKRRLPQSDHEATRVVKRLRSHAPNTQRRLPEIKDEDTTVVKREQEDFGMRIRMHLSRVLQKNWSKSNVQDAQMLQLGLAGSAVRALRLRLESQHRSNTEPTRDQGSSFCICTLRYKGSFFADSYTARTTTHASHRSSDYLASSMTRLSKSWLLVTYHHQTEQSCQREELFQLSATKRPLVREEHHAEVLLCTRGSYTCL